jgi:aspartokinase/homoserine dehydrogenase 1
MAGAKGVAARIFAALRKAAVNVVAIAQGSSELNISVVVDAMHAAQAQRAIHRAFLLDKVGGGAVGEPARRDLVLLGFGQIGRRVSLLAAAARRDRVELRVVGVIDRSGVVFDPKGLSPARLRTLVAWKSAGKQLATAKGGRNLPPADAVRWIADHALHEPILADVTAGDTAPIVREALISGIAVVLANKKPLTGPIAQMEDLLALADHNGRPLRRETTVGAGLPILDTFDKLVESGDRVRRIDGCLSGTLGFLFDQLSNGISFSAALEAAQALGYTEPDPRDDLSGLDVARKALSLARLLGYRGELSDVTIESLVPADATRMPVDRFLANLPRYNASWATRIATAAAKGRVLRYVASASARGVKVGLAEVDASSPFFGLRATDNQVVFVTDRYRERPLVITGPGAGPDVTAAGVMNDVLALARVGA